MRCDLGQHDRERRDDDGHGVVRRRAGGGQACRGDAAAADGCATDLRRHGRGDDGGRPRRVAPGGEHGLGPAVSGDRGHGKRGRHDGWRWRLDGREDSGGVDVVDDVGVAVGWAVAVVGVSVGWAGGAVGVAVGWADDADEAHGAAGAGRVLHEVRTAVRGSAGTSAGSDIGRASSTTTSSTTRHATSNATSTDTDTNANSAAQSSAGPVFQDDVSSAQHCCYRVSLTGMTTIHVQQPRSHNQRHGLHCQIAGDFTAINNDPQDFCH